MRRLMKRSSSSKLKKLVGLRIRISALNIPGLDARYSIPFHIFVCPFVYGQR